MWRKNDSQSGAPEAETPSSFAPEAGSEPARGRGGEGTHLGKTISVKGEITGREDLYLDGELDGTIRLADARLTVGPSGRLRAEAEARDIDVFGEVHGTLAAGERVRIGRTGRIEGNLVTKRLAVEEGAVIRGNVEVARPGEARAPKAREAAAASASGIVTATGSEPATKREPIN